MTKKVITDPEYERYKRNYPKFPGIQKCTELLRQANMRGAYLDAVLFDLETHLSEYIQEVLAAFRIEESVRVRILLISIIAKAKLPETIPFLIENLLAVTERIRYWSIIGLENTGSKEARQALWEARTYKLATPEETKEFHQLLDKPLDRLRNP